MHKGGASGISTPGGGIPRGHGMTLLYAVLLTGQLGLLVALTVGGFLWLGYRIGVWLDSVPAFTVIGILFGLVITAIEIRYWLAPLLRLHSRHD